MDPNLYDPVYVTHTSTDFRRSVEGVTDVCISRHRKRKERLQVQSRHLRGVRKTVDVTYGITLIRHVKQLSGTQYLSNEKLTNDDIYYGVTKLVCKNLSPRYQSRPVFGSY